jgi:hypothetical protein
VPAVKGLEAIMVIAIASLLLAAQLGTAQATAPTISEVQKIQYRVPAHPPPCGDGWDLAVDGLCYPNGTVPYHDQVARRYGRYRHPVPCGNGADVDIRDGRCYPNGTVPRRFQQGRQYQYRY